jgi:hypothetical protein
MQKHPLQFTSTSAEFLDAELVVVVDMVFRRFEFVPNSLEEYAPERWSPEIGQCAKVDSRTLTKEEHP